MDEYIFGIFEDTETLRTKTKENKVLIGFCETVRDFDSEKIIDSFHIDKLTNEEESNGWFYKWYNISQHYQIIDKSDGIYNTVDKNKEAIEDGLCDVDTTMDERIAVIEDALCEMDMNR